MNYYIYPQETWSEAKCKKVLSKKHTDGMGTKHHRGGFIANSSSSNAQYGQTIRFNGGCVREGEWYDGETRPLPIVPKGWGFEKVSSWGTYLIRK